jgi:PAS domain S-box-containing protein
MALQSQPANLVNVRGTRLLDSDTREQYRQKLARITLDSMVQFVGLLDAKGTVLEINHVALDAVGVKLSEVEGKPFWTTFWWQVSAEINATLRDAIRRASQGEFVRWDAEIYGRSGGKETIIIDASLVPVKDEQGSVVFITAEGRDITEKKAHEREIARQREELAELDELKTQFFANISHEFRTPLTLMMGPLEDAMASSEKLSASNRERMELAHRNSLRLLKLVNTLLDFSRIEAGRVHASYEPTDLATFTAGLASVFRSAIERAGLRLLINCPQMVEPVYLDREMWEKIVFNLLSNAFKFTLEGEIEVSVRSANGLVELAVRDTGTGIPPQELPHLFQRFYRVKGAQGRTFEGSGIGLALVQELAQLHGGTVRVESELEHGSTFIVTVPIGKDHLPADRIGAQRTLTSTGLRGEAYVQEALRWLPESQSLSQDLQVATLPSSPGPLQTSIGEGERRSCILLADDNADMREYLERLLSEQYEVVAVADGESALSSARERRPDLILSDIMMPRLNGIEVLRSVRAEESLKNIPVILLTARAGEESRIEGLASGADDYLVKPFSARELLARISSNLAIARIRGEAAELERKLRLDAELEVRARTTELEERNGDVLRQSEQVRDLSWRLLRIQDDERRRIARDLHDSAGQTLAVLSMELAEFVQKAGVTAPELTTDAEMIQQTVQQLHREMRTASYLLHPPLLDEAGLSSALDWYVQGLMERSGLEISFTISEGFTRLPGDLELAVFRLVQECLTNIHRHSGSKTALIRIALEADLLTVSIEDQGKGMSPARLAEIQSHGSGVGIRGIRERLRQFKGQMDIESDSSGTRVLVTIPIPKTDVPHGQNDIEPVSEAS